MVKEVSGEEVHIHFCITDIWWEVQEIPPKGRTAEPVNPTLHLQGLSDVPSPYVSYFLTMYLCWLQWTHWSWSREVFLLRVLHSRPSYQWKNRFDIKEPCKGNRRCHYTAVTKQSLFCRALCLQEPSKKHSSVTPSHNPVHALIQVETEQHIKGCRRATIVTNHLGTELRSSQPKTTNDNTPWPAKSNPCTKGVEQLLSPLNRPERDWWLASTCLIKNRWKYIIALIVSA